MVILIMSGDPLQDAEINRNQKKLVISYMNNSPNYESKYNARTKFLVKEGKRGEVVSRKN